MTRPTTIILSAIVFSAIGLSGVAAGSPQDDLTSPRQAPPTALDFQWAMETSLPSDIGGHPVILGRCVVARVQCQPPGPDGRSECRFDEDGPKKATLTKIDGVWKYLSGDHLRCEVTTG